MDEQAWISHWVDVYENVFFVGPPAMKNRPTPENNHLDRLEKALSIPLPFSFKAFVKVFGPGTVAQCIDVYSPGYKGLSTIDFLGNNSWQKDEAKRRENASQIEGLLSFANLNYQDFVWDTCCITNPEEFEYKIFYLPKKPSEALIKICDSFPEFIEEWCFTGKYWELLGSEPVTSWEDEETGQIHPMKCYFPIGEKPTSAV